MWVAAATTTMSLRTVRGGRSSHLAARGARGTSILVKRRCSHDAPARRSSYSLPADYYFYYHYLWNSACPTIISASGAIRKQRHKGEPLSMLLRGVPPLGVFRGVSVSFSLACCIQWLRFPLAQTTWLPWGIASTHRPSRRRTPSTARATDRAPTRPFRPGQDEADTEAAGAQAAEGEA